VAELLELIWPELDGYIISANPILAHGVFRQSLYAPFAERVRFQHANSPREQPLAATIPAVDIAAGAQLSAGVAPAVYRQDPGADSEQRAESVPACPTAGLWY